MYSGVFLFFLGWVKLIYSIPLCLAILWCLRSKFKNSKSDIYSEIFISRPALILIIFSCIIFGIICGYGAFFPQAGDWGKSNAILNDLITHKWPVYYHNDDSSSMLTYYIGHYLLPAVVGKITNSYRVAEIFILVHNVIGIICIAFLLFTVVEAKTFKKQILTLIILFSFGTCLFLGKGLYAVTSLGASDTSPTWYWMSSSVFLIYRTFFNAFRWIPQMTIVPFIATVLFFKNYRHLDTYCLIGLPVLICGSFQFLGLFVMMLGALIYIAFTSKDKGYLLKKIFCLPNIVLGICLLVIVIYLAGNVFGDKPDLLSLNWIDYGANTALYFCFVLTFLIYSFIIFHYQKSNPLFYISNISLLIFPFFSYGTYNDLEMNGTMPACFILAILIIQSLFEYRKSLEKHLVRFIILILALAIGVIYPLKEVVSVIKSPVSFQGAYPTYSLSEGARRDGTIQYDLAYNYYTYDYENSLFYKFFARSH